MPYADAERQRAAKAASARRRRAAQRGTIVEPVRTPVSVTSTDLFAAGRLLGQMKGDTESWEQYHTRLRAVWQHLLRVVDA